MPAHHSLSNIAIPANFGDRFLPKRPNTMDHCARPEYRSTPTHSRDSSVGSNVSSPLASVFSTRAHSRWPSSTSSLATTPESPSVLAKPALHDLVEDPSERDDEPEVITEEDVFTGFCLCDLSLCEHQQNRSVPHTPHDSSSFASGASMYGGTDDELAMHAKRRGSDESTKDNTAARLSRRLPSIARRWRNRQSSRSISSPTLQSPPPSRSSSLRKLRRKQPSVPQLHSPRSDPRSFARESDAFDYDTEPDLLDDPFFLDYATDSVHEEVAARSSCAVFTSQGPPKTRHSRQTPSLGFLPLTETSRTHSVFSSPISSPTSPAMWSQTLSTKPSLASMRTTGSRHPPDVPSMALSDEFDLWSIKLGHANFHIQPEPYLPELCTTESCKRLLEDWETARVAFMRHAAQTLEHHGPSSKTHKFTCEKWEEIDAQWRSNFELVRSYCPEEASGGAERPVSLRALPETQTCLPMPSLSDPQNPDKFPVVEAADIVGPMLRYDDPHPPQQDATPKKPMFLRLLTDAASLLRKSQ